LKRDQVAKFFANLQPCLIGMEACGSVHHWARKLQGFGHDVRRFCRGKDREANEIDMKSTTYFASS
jgi:hypothetical protein